MYDSGEKKSTVNYLCWWLFQYILTLYLHFFFISFFLFYFFLELVPLLLTGFEYFFFSYFFIVVSSKPQILFSLALLSMIAGCILRYRTLSHYFSYTSIICCTECFMFLYAKNNNKISHVTDNMKRKKINAF